MGIGVNNLLTFDFNRLLHLHSRLFSKFSTFSTMDVEKSPSFQVDNWFFGLLISISVEFSLLFSGCGGRILAFSTSPVEKMEDGVFRVRVWVLSHRRIGPNWVGWHLLGIGKGLAPGGVVENAADTKIVLDILEVTR